MHSRSTKGAASAAKVVEAIDQVHMSSIPPPRSMRDEMPHMVVFFLECRLAPLPPQSATNRQTLHRQVWT